MFAINHNLSAANVANTLTGHYGRLQTSTQRLSSGLRVNSAADDAAGLAIRELQRADIAALHQGARNTNDAISMLQTFDGALGVIDEKLIRMKELAEQAATGTYDSTQRLMIDSEFQAMASEINRIANATDFNGIKLINGNGVEGPTMRGIAPFALIPDAGGNSSYNVNAATGKMVNQVWPNETASQIGGWDLSGITDPAKLAAAANISITNDNVPRIGDDFLMVTPANVGVTMAPGNTLDVQWDSTNHRWTINGYGPTTPGATITGGDTGFTYSGPDIDPTKPSFSASVSLKDENGNTAALQGDVNLVFTMQQQPSFTWSDGVNTGKVNAAFDPNNANILNMEIDLGDNNIIRGSFNVSNGEDRALAAVDMSLTSQWIDPNANKPVNPNDPNNPNGPNGSNNGPGIPDLFKDKVKIHFGTGNDSAEDYYYIRKYDATTKGLGIEGLDIQTQDKAQKALVQINDAIVAKDKIRADYGALQNRLENTLANITIQAENLQAAESRISDVDVATEMTNFVRNQILTQSAVAMLTQANSLPQMAMQLIG